MKILAIRIKNLASLDGETEIDFTREPLCSAGIFAITGPTGAGKSTILDALCLALYAKTPRYMQQSKEGIVVLDVNNNTISQTDVKSVLRRGTADGYAEVDFVGIDKIQYRARWSVRRAKNHILGKLQDHVITLRNISLGTDVGGKNTELLTEIERLVGLSFDQFTRSVLLAQGDFTAFLKASKDEKSALLEKLTGTEIYTEISKRIFERHRHEALQLRELTIQKEGIAILTGEEQDELNRQKIGFETSVQAQEKEVNELGKEIIWHEQHTKLKSALEIADSNHVLAVTNRDAAIHRNRKLQQIEKVQPTRSWVDGLHNGNRQLSDKQRLISELEERLKVFTEQKKTIEVSLETAETNLLSATKINADAQPLLNQAKALDVQIKEKREQLSKASEEVTRISESLKQQKEKQEDANQTFNVLSGTIEQLQEWKTQHAGKQPIAENQGLIVSKLSDVQKLSDTLDQLHIEYQTVQDTIKENNERKEKLILQKTELESVSRQMQQAVESKQNEIASITVDELEKQKSDDDIQLEETIRAQAHWKLLFTASGEYVSGKKILLQHKNDFTDKKGQQQQTEKLLNTATNQREVSSRLLEKARLVTTERVETLRAQLIHDEPCPVCGSKEHPYATENPVLDHVLAGLDAEYQRYEKEYAQYLTQNSSLQEACNQLQKTIEASELQLALKKTAIKELESDWSTFSLYGKSMDIPDEEKAEWINSRLLSQKKLQKELAEKIQSYHRQRQEIESEKNRLNEALKQIDGLDNTIKDTERSIHSSQEKLLQNSKDSEKANNDLAGMKDALSIYFSAEDWFNQWKSNPESFVGNVKDFASKWKENLEKLDRHTSEHGLLGATIQNLGKRAEEISEETETKQRLYTNAQELADKLVSERKNLFSGQEVLQVEYDLKKNIDAATQNLEKYKTERDTNHTELTRITSQKETEEKTCASIQQQVMAHKENITRWLTNYNKSGETPLGEEVLVELLTHTSEWMETERKSLRIIDDAFTQAQSVLIERKEQLTQHHVQRISDRDEATLQRMWQEVKKILQQTTQQKNEVDFRLQQNENNRQKVGNLLSKIESQTAIVENWAKLNEIIGSFNGQKFRLIAQEYTLDILLGYANVHMGILNKRYILQRIPGTLGLQVLDQDMGNEVRTVFSLSGGESFLVSLALALALASLSSSRMQVESLFIDEGFGSLDPTTLNVAMDALDNLHNQGRKVGVISHVQDMMDTIPVQIRVSKKQSGKSLVEVIQL